MLTVDSVSGTAPQELVSASRYPFTGTINGGAATLQFSGLLTSATIYGTLNSDSLTLQVPQTDGAIQPGTLTQSDTGPYNAAVAALNRRIRHANALAAEAQAQAQQQQQNARAEQTAQNDISTLDSDLSSFVRDSQTASSDLAIEKETQAATTVSAVPRGFPT